MIEPGTTEAESEDFTDELSDEALDRDVREGRLCAANCFGGSVNCVCIPS